MGQVKQVLVYRKQVLTMFRTDSCWKTFFFPNHSLFFLHITVFHSVFIRISIIVTTIYTWCININRFYSLKNRFLWYVDQVRTRKLYFLQIFYWFFTLGIPKCTSVATYEVYLWGDIILIFYEVYLWSVLIFFGFLFHTYQHFGRVKSIDNHLQSYMMIEIGSYPCTDWEI